MQNYKLKSMLFNFGLQTVMYTCILIHMYMNVHTLVKCWREGALLVSELGSGSRGLDSNPLESLCFWCLFLCICILTHWQIQCWIVTCNGLASRTEKSGNTFSCFAKQIDWLRIILTSIQSHVDKNNKLCRHLFGGRKCK